MPQAIIIFAQTALATVGYTAAALVGGSIAYSTALYIGAAVIVGGSVVAKKAMSLFEMEMPQVDSDVSRQSTAKTTVAPQKIIYGEALVSGPISYIALSGASNADLYQTIVLAGHEVNAITDIHFDDEVITNAQIAAGLNDGSNTAGDVTGGTFGPIDSNTICIINKHLGAASQASDPMLTNKFALYTSAHRGDGVAYLAMKWTLDEDSAEVWEKYSPGNVKALVQGKQVYDPRLEVTAGGTAGANPTTAAYVAYSTNPALCVTDYLIDQTLGMGIAASKINWAAVITAADGCDVDVDVPNSATQKRFTANGVLFGTDSHQKNINKLLSAMNGRLIYSNGEYIVKAGIYEAPTEVLTEDDLIGAIQIKTSLERSDRFNTIRGIFVDAAANNKSTEFPKVQLTDAVTRDNGEVLEKEIQLPMVSDSYQAQRIANKLIQLSDQQKIISFPANLGALRITAGDRVQVTVEELSWSQKVFECIGWTFSDEGGVNLTLREDSSTSYGDPLPAAYSQITASGTIVDAFRGVPSPSGLSATAGLKNNVLNWVNPGKPSDFGTIYVYASPNGNFSSAVKIGETDGTQFVHDASTAADAVASGDLRYYWVRAIKNVGTDDAARSNLEPNADPNTTVFATVGRVNWADVSGSTDAPQSNATVGAQISVNLVDVDGTTVMGAADVKNSVLAQEILEVEVEAGQVLNLETGADVDIQNLGDVAIFVSDSNVTLNTSINTVASNLSQLEDAIIDLTSGVSDIYIQATEPVAGVGGIPNPIPQFSRWYDSDDGNAPYYWSGSVWVSFKDADIADNTLNITNLTANLATTDGNVTANSSSISALDTLTIAQGGSITSLSGSVTALQSTVNNATTGVAANAGAVSSLTTRVTNTEDATTVNAGNITTLTADLDQAEVDIATKASSTAVSGLTTRVVAAEGSIVTNAGDITALESTVDNATTGVVATSGAVNALTTRVTNTEDATTVNAGAVTTLNATYTEDLHYRTEAEDESDDLIDLESSGTVQLQDLSDLAAGSSAAIQSLTVQTYANEDGIQTQAIQLTALESTVNDPANGVVATAGALSTLSTSVTVIDGQVTTTAQDLTALTTTVGGNTATITTQSNSIDGVEANYGVKIDNNNRVSGFGLLSTTAGSTPFSEFAIVADQFSIVSPDSTADTPIQPFTVTADKIYFGADVIVSGDLISTGTISADRLQIDGVMFDTETVGNVTSLVIKASGVNTSQIAESAITTARLSNDAVTVDKFANTLQSTNYVADTSGWQILTSGNVEFQNATINGTVTSAAGNIGGFTLGSTSLIAGDAATRVSISTADGIHLGNNTFASAPFRVSPAGALTATSANITGDIVAETLTVTEANITGTLTLGGGVLQDGSGNNLTTNTTLNSTQIMSEVSGIVSPAQYDIPSFWRITTNDNAAPSNSEFNTAAGRLAKVNDIVITTDTTTTPDTTYGWTCTLAGVADPATEATWAAITNLMSGDLIVDGSIGADQINAESVRAAVITANSITTEELKVAANSAALNADPNIEDSTAWVKWAGTDAVFTTITDGAVGNNVIRSNGTSSSGTWYNSRQKFALDPTKTYRMTVIARRTSDANGTFYAGVAAFTAAGTNISITGSQWSYGAASSVTPATTDWIRYTMQFGAGTLIPLPSTGKTFSPLVILNYDNTAGYYEAQDIRIEEKISASLIVDGTITASQLSADSVTADKISSNAIGTSELTVGIGTSLGLADTANQDSTATIQADTLAAATSSDVGLANVENLDAQDQAQTGLIAGTTITGGGITMSAGGAIKTTGKDSESDTTNGYFLGYNSSSAEYTFGIGDADRSMVWDGSKLNVNANAVSFTTGGHPDYSSNSRFPTSLRSSVLDLSSNADYVFFDNSFDQNLTLYASFYAGELTSGTVAGLTNAQNAVMSNLSIQIQYAPNVGGSPGTWVDFGSAALSAAKFTASQLSSNYYVKTTDLGSGNYRADLATSDQAAQDFTGVVYSEFAYGITDEDYYMTEGVIVYGFPKGEYFLRVVVAVTDGSYAPYPSTGSPDVTNPRRLSIANAITYQDSNHGTSSIAKGSPISYFTGKGISTNTSINGGNLVLAVSEHNEFSNTYAGAFILGRGATTDASSTRPLGGIWFYNSIDSFGSGAGDLGSPDHSISMPKTGDSLNIEAAGNGIKFNGGYGSTGATIDTNGNISTDGKIITNDLDITAPSGSDAVLKFIQDGSSYASWKIRADGGDDAVMYFNQYNGSNTATGTIAFTSTGGILATGAGSYGNGFANGGVSISSDGNYQGAGNINITGTLTQGSDARLKSNVETIDGSKVFEMRGVSFMKLRQEGAGVIAQELQAIAPALVHTDKNGFLSVAYMDLCGYFIEAIKLQKTEIDQLKNEIRIIKSGG